MRTPKVDYDALALEILLSDVSARHRAEQLRELQEKAARALPSHCSGCGETHTGNVVCPVRPEQGDETWGDAAEYRE